MLCKKAFPEAERIMKVTSQNPVWIKDEKIYTRTVSVGFEREVKLPEPHSPAR